MRRLKLPYEEGTWFAIPLKNEGFGIGIVARMEEKGGILTYLFEPRRAAPPDLTEIEHLSADQAIRVLIIGDLHLIKRKWPIIGKSRNWQRTCWPMPDFIRREIGSRRAWRVKYSDESPFRLIAEIPEDGENSILETNSLWGAEAVEIYLSNQLSL